MNIVVLVDAELMKLHQRHLNKKIQGSQSPQSSHPYLKSVELGETKKDLVAPKLLTSAKMTTEGCLHLSFTIQ